MTELSRDQLASMKPFTNEEIDKFTDPLTRDGHYQHCFDENGEPTCGGVRCEVRRVEE